MSQTIAGVAAEYLQAKFGGLYQATETVQTLGPTNTRIVPNDPERVFLYIGNIGTEIANIRPLQAADGGDGFLVAAFGGSFSFNLIEDFIMPTLEYNGLGAGAGTTVFVATVRRVAKDPMGGDDNAG